MKKRSREKSHKKMRKRKRDRKMNRKMEKERERESVQSEMQLTDSFCWVCLYECEHKFRRKCANVCQENAITVHIFCIVIA